MLAVGRGYEDLAMFSEAALAYEQFQQRYPDAKGAAELLYNAGVFRENLGDFERAARDYTSYVNRYPGEKDVPLTEFAIAQLLEKQARWKEAAAMYAQLVNKNRGNADFYLTALCKRGDAQTKLNDASAAQSSYRQALAAYASHRAAERPALSVETLDLLGKAHFRLAEPMMAEYLRAKLNVPLVQFATAIQRKIRLLGEVEREYQKIVAYGSGTWTANAIFRIAVAYDDFASNLGKVQEPTALPQQDRQGFMQQLRETAQNMRQKATEAYSACIDKAAAADVFDPVVARAEKRLADLSAKPRIEVKEFVHEPIFVYDAIGKGGLL
jgi:tetratricopeptide (TPR) repeat protein